MKREAQELPSSPFWRVARKHLCDPRGDFEFGEYSVETKTDPPSLRLSWSHGVLEVTAKGLSFTPSKRDEEPFSVDWREVKSTKKTVTDPLRITTAKQSCELRAETRDCGLLLAVHSLLLWVLHVRASGRELAEYGIEA